MPTIPKEDIILLLLAAPAAKSGSGELSGVTRLEKLIFLAQEEMKGLDDSVEAFKFKPWKFGPFSEEIYEALDMLCNVDLVDVRERKIASYPEFVESEGLVDVAEQVGVVEKVFKLTDRGQRVADILQEELPPGVWDAICQLKKRLGELPLTRLIHYVYHKYPETTTESVLDHLKPKD